MLPSHVQLYRGDFPYGFYFVSLHGNLCAVVWVRGKQVNIKMPLPLHLMVRVAKGHTFLNKVILHRWAVAWINASLTRNTF